MSRPAASASRRVRDLLAGVLDGRSVEVGPRARGGGRGVRHLVGAGGCQPYLLQRDPQRRGGDLEHLRVEPLPHLGAAVVDQDRAVLVDVDQGAGLVERHEVEGDAELHRGHGQPALGVRVRGVEGRDLRPPLLDPRGGEDLVPDEADPLGVPHDLAVRRALAVGVEVAAAQLQRVDAEQGRAAPEDVLDDQHPLGSAEAPEGGLRRLVGARDPPAQPDVRDVVGVVHVAQGPRQHRLRQVEAPSAVEGEGDLERLQQPVRTEADAPLGADPVPLAGHGEVLRAGESDPDGPTGDHAAEGGDRGVAVGLHLLAAEGPTHAQGLHGDVVVAQAEHPRDDVLGLGGVLGGALDEDLPGLVDLGQRALGLEVEVLLAGRLGDPAEDVRGRRESALDVPALDRRLDALEARRGDRLGDREECRQRLVVDLDGGGTEPRRLQRLAQHPADGVPDVHHLAREERLVVPDPRVVDARDVLGAEHPDHAGHLQGGGGPERGHPRVGVRRLHRVGMQAAPRPDDQVVGVERGAGDVEGRALVRHRDGRRRRRRGGSTGRSCRHPAPVVRPGRHRPEPQQGLLEHRGPVGGAGPVVVDRRALAAQDDSGRTDGLGRPRRCPRGRARWPVPGSGSARPHPARSGRG